MWQQITTLSELDTVKTGTLLSKNDPVKDSNTPIFKVTSKNDKNITMNAKEEDPTRNITEIKTDKLFDDGWWMLKNE
jgi:hypothetical protein